ncbi:MAG: DUF167 family protein [Candidatus Micrarchaeota archaeon]
MKINARVFPNSGKFSLSLKENVLQIRCKNEAEKGLVNREIILNLSKMLGMEVRILRGLKGRNKILEVNGNEQSVKSKVQGIISQGTG